MSELGVGAGAQAARLLVADVDGDIGSAQLQRLQIGVDRHELDPGNVGIDHAVDGVDAGPADADHPNHGLMGLAAARRLIGGLLAPIAGRFDHRGNLTSQPRLLREDLFQPLLGRGGLAGRLRRWLSLRLALGGIVGG